MKAKRIFLFSVIAVAATMLWNCKGGAGGGDAKSMIAQKWQWESMQSKAMDEQMAMLKTQADTTKDSTAKAMVAQSMQMMDGIMEAMKSTIMEFKADGTFENSMTMMGKTESKKGKWSLSEDGKKLFSTEPKMEGGEKTDTIAIKEITAEKLVLAAPDGKGGDMTITMKAVK